MPDDEDMLEDGPEDAPQGGDDEVDADEIDEDVIDVDGLEDGDEEFGDDEFGAADDDEVVDVVVVDDDETGTDDEPLPRGRKKADDEESDDEDDVDPDDVEADLQSILEDRIAATEDEEDEDELEVDTRPGAEGPDGVAPKRAHEFMCNGCFLLVSPAQFGKPDLPRCPVGEEDCPAIDELFGAGGAPAPVKAVRAPAKAAGKATKVARKR